MESLEKKIIDTEDEKNGISDKKDSLVIKNIFNNAVIVLNFEILLDFGVRTKNKKLRNPIFETFGKVTTWKSWNRGKKPRIDCKNNLFF